MFGIGFWELVVLLVIGLLVVGPDRLPAFARETARWVRRVRRFTTDARREIERELALDEADQFKRKLSEMDRLMQDAPDRESSRPTPPAPVVDTDDDAKDDDGERR